MGAGGKCPPARGKAITIFSGARVVSFQRRASVTGSSRIAPAPTAPRLLHPSRGEAVAARGGGYALGCAGREEASTGFPWGHLSVFKVENLGKHLLV